MEVTVWYAQPLIDAQLQGEPKYPSCYFCSFLASWNNLLDLSPFQRGGTYYYGPSWKADRSDWFPNTLGFPADMVDAPVHCLVTDTPKCPFRCSAWPPVWFTEELRQLSNHEEGQREDGGKLLWNSTWQLSGKHLEDIGINSRLPKEATISN